MTFPALAHVAVTVRDLAVSGPWYRTLFGADPVLDEDTDAGFHGSGLSFRDPDGIALEFFAAN
ncbi:MULTISPECIES: VOC family protein [unclassified Mycolicibacterium]|uniref:VOC family protein n=1 Tax=unclassified Mycolicibacterium TaxID=2636767 RepID=UPI0012DFE046|nr:MULTISPECIES: VOC family protein [unclassified Mycolicibacterium]MUL83783.1 VOC family protein [Mycolicibacterium sp. CBMA 329]MUL90774.1 VOC family protein [Mycolicibacterium sp. CBMA 331]MUM00742.1 VOC family protein [Mycolicibacterium sp. CBMA 334]MUM29475.1 VOC family protein [Mycolicibacterium sp. CBMA 295]MUM41718.1 VOC family protein [Mycolicibacterium sp. CBMA 247]